MQKIELLKWPDGAKSIMGGFCGRQGGVSTGPFSSLNAGLRTAGDSPENTAENRRRIALALSGKEIPIALAHQVHGTRVITVSQPADAIWTPDEPADALVTSTPGVFVGVITADCVPVLVVDVERGIVAAVHCGWRSAFGNIAREVVQAMVALGADAPGLKAALGPCIHQSSYEVDQIFYEAFQSQDPASAKAFFIPGKPGHFWFDLPRYVIHTFHAAGVRDVEPSHDNTFTQPERFFSHRWAQQHTGGQRGCQLSLIGLMA